MNKNTTVTTSQQKSDEVTNDPSNFFLTGINIETTKVPSQVTSMT
jgi:hypothetical protein